MIVSCKTAPPKNQNNVLIWEFINGSYLIFYPTSKVIKIYILSDSEIKQLQLKLEDDDYVAT